MQKTRRREGETMKEPHSQQLERLVDLYGLSSVVQELHNICNAKALHVEENWQDDGLAKLWSRAGACILKADCAPVRALGVRYLKE